MRKGIVLKTVTAFLILCIIFPASIGIAGTAPSFTVTASPAGQSYKAGDLVTFTVSGFGLKDMYAFEAVLVFDPAMVKYESSKVRLSGSGLPVSKVIDDSKAIFAFTRIGEATGEDGDKALCDISFKVLAEGKTNVKLDSIKIVKTDKSSQSYKGNSLNLQAGSVKDKDSIKITLSASDIKVDKKTGIAKAKVDAALLQSSFDKAQKDGKGIRTVEIIIPKTAGVKVYEQVLPVSFFMAADPLKAVRINTETAIITVRGNMFAETNITDATEMSLTIAQGDKSKLKADIKSQIGSRPVLELTLKVSGKTVTWDSHTSAVTVAIPYKPTAKELKDMEHIAVLYLNGSDKSVPVSSGRYIKETGRVTFGTWHLSTFAIAFVNKTFTDLSKYSWASKQIDVLASKGIVSGVSSKSYSPAAKITRADFLAYLVRTLDLNAVVKNNFSDILKKDSYYNELGIAKKLGITTGTGNNKFSPKAPITRQDMMVMTARAMKIAGKLDSEGNAGILDKFTDKAKISSYASGSIAALVEAGLITGSSNKVNPKSNTTRAEAAVLLYRIYNME